MELKSISSDHHSDIAGQYEKEWHYPADCSIVLIPSSPINHIHILFQIHVFQQNKKNFKIFFLTHLCNAIDLHIINNFTCSHSLYFFSNVPLKKKYFSYQNDYTLMFFF